MADVRKLLRVLAVVSALSVSAVSSGQSLVVYEGTANVDYVSNNFGLLPFTAALGDEFRFRAIIDSSMQGSPPNSLGLVSYEGAIRDLAIWINGQPVTIPATYPEPDASPFNNIIYVGNNASIDGQTMDALYLLWDQLADDGNNYRFGFILEDNDAVMLSSTDIPTAIGYSLADYRTMGFHVVARTGAEDQLGVNINSLVIEPVPSVSGLLQQLLTESTGVGPGKSLANKVSLAQTYYAVPDLQATCAVLKSFLHEVAAQSGKKLSTVQAQALSGDAGVIMRTMACE